MNELYVYIYPLPLEPPFPLPTHLSRSSQGTELCYTEPVLCSIFPLAIYFTHESVYMSMRLLRNSYHFPPQKGSVLGIVSYKDILHWENSKFKKNMQEKIWSAGEEKISSWSLVRKEESKGLVRWSGHHGHDEVFQFHTKYNGCCCCCQVASVVSDSVRPHRRQRTGSPVPGILQARALEQVAISFSNAWKWKVKVKSLSRAWLLATSWTAAHQDPPSMGFSRSGVPLPWISKSQVT